MRLSDIKEEVKEAIGKASNTQLIYRTVTRAIELLANKGLCDPLKAYLDIVIPDGTYTIALPREVKKPLRINLNSNPSFPRSQIFEFTMNTDGSVEGEEVGWAWADRGRICIQDETKFPVEVRYQVTHASDVGKTVKIKYRDTDGVIHAETLSGVLDPDDGTGTTETVREIIRVTREATTQHAFLVVEEDSTWVGIARYYADELEPLYRAIKLSKTDVAARILFRRQTFKIASDDDEIPIDSPMAVIQAVKAVRLYQEEAWENAEKALQAAEKFLQEEQATMDEPHELSSLMDASTAANLNISTRDSVVVADIYDDAAEIFGPIGRPKLFDKITLAIEALANKHHWDSSTGYVDLWASGYADAVNPRGRAGNGYYVLPAGVEAPISINYDGRPMIPRNRWFEFSLAGLGGERNYSSCSNWDDLGEVVLINPLPLDPDTKKVIPTRIVAQPDSPVDNGTEIIAYGMERLPDGIEVEVYRNGSPGWTVPCVYGSFAVGSDAPDFVHIERIKKAESEGFIKLIGFPEAPTNIAVTAGCNKASSQDALERMIKRRHAADIILAGNAATGFDESQIQLTGNASCLFTGQAPDGGDNFSDADISGIYTLTPIDGLPAGWVAYLRNEVGFPPMFVAGEPGNFRLYRGTDYPPVGTPIGPLVSETLIGTYSGSVGDQGFPPSAQFTTAWVDSMTAELDNDCGANWRKFIYPFIGSAELRPGEVDATENHFWPAPGDADWEDTLLGWLSYFDGAHGGERYYSKVFGSVHVFFLSSSESEPDGNTVGSDQELWLREQVAASDSPWKIAVFHHPPYASHTSIDPGFTDLRWDWADIGIHAVIAGQRFSYERLETGGVVYFNIQQGASSESVFASPLPESKDHNASGYVGLFIYGTRQSLRFLVVDKDGNQVDAKELVSSDNNYVDPLLLGYYHPLETEPKYRLIKLPSHKAKRIRVRYRRRWLKIRNLFDAVPLRSKLAIVTMMQAIKMRQTDVAQAELLEVKAVQYLKEEQRTMNTVPGKLNIDPEMQPGVTTNMM